MATYVFIGDEERTFDEDRLHGLAPSTVRTGDRVKFVGPARMHHALNPDLVPDDADTRREAELIREQVRVADARDFAASTAGKVDQTTAGAAELIARSEGRSKGGV